MAQSIGSREAEIKQLIYEDLTDLAQRAGLKDPRFGATRLIQNGVLPGSHKQQIAIYHNLILNNIDNVEPREVREALCVKLNLCEGYPDSGSQRRLGILGRKWGRTIPSDGAEMGNSKQTENQARAGQKFLASLICKEIEDRVNRNTWKELQDEIVRTPGDSSLSADIDAPSYESITLTQAQTTSGAQILGPGARRHEYSRVELATSTRPSRAEVSAYPIAPSVLKALERARQACETANQKFVTPHLLLALLDLPNSQVTQCFNQAKANLANEWRELLEAYRERALSNETFGEYLEVDWNRRKDVWRSKELALHEGVQAVTELYLLRGILDNPRSKTRRELEEYLGTERYEYLCQVAESMSDDTPGHADGPQ